MKNDEYIKNAFTPQELKSGCFRNWDGVSNVLTHSFIKHLSKHIEFDNIKIILDIGSRDACQSLEFNRWFPNAKIYAFEPVQSNANWCSNATRNIENITIVPNAVGLENKKILFNVVTNGNVGASSIYKVSNHPRSRAWAQIEVEVDCIRLDDWLIQNEIEKVDLMWVDVQGAEKLVFNGMSDFLRNVDGIATEIGLVPLYEGATSREELDVILCEDFQLLELQPEPQQTEADAIYLNRKYL